MILQTTLLRTVILLAAVGFGSMNCFAQQPDGNTYLPTGADTIYGDVPQLIYATYWGGSDDDDEAENMVIDSQGSIIVAGQTKSTDLPVTAGAFQQSIVGERDIMIAKYSADNDLLWATYLGGDSSEYAYGLAVDMQDNIYVSGETESLNFPVLNAWQDTLYDDWDGFISKFDAEGTLLWSTYYGADDDDVVNGVSVDDEGRVYVCGNTESEEFPTTPGAFQEEITGWKACFVSRFTPDGDVVWCTYFNGSDEENGNDILVDPNNDIFVIGEAYSPDCPITPGFYQDEIAGSDDALLLKMDSLGTVLISTVVGGSDDDDGRKVQIDQEGNIYIIGDLVSDDFPTTDGAFQSEVGGDHDAFVSKFTNDGDLIWATYIGGDSCEYVYGCDIDQFGRVFVLGETYSGDFPTTDEALQDDLSDIADMYISTFDDIGNVQWSTYFGGNDDDDAAELRFHDGKMYVVGTCESTDMPITNDALQPDNAGWEDVYIAIFEYEEIIISGAPEIERAGFSVYPSPARDIVNVRLTGSFADDHIVQVYNSSGSLMLTRAMQNGQDLLQLNVSSYASGNYKVVIRKGDFPVAVRSVVIE